LLPAHELRHCRTRQYLVLCQQRPQSIVHQGLAIPRRQLQDLQILPIRLANVLTQGVISHAEPARGKQVIAVTIAGERTRLAHQPIDDVPIVDAVLVTPPQPRQPLHALLAVPHLQMLDVNPHFDALAEQPAVHRVDIAMYVNHAALGHRHGQSLAALQTTRGQGPQQRPLLGQAFLPARVAPLRYRTQQG